MKNALLGFIAAGIAIVVGFYAFNAYIYDEKQADPGDVVSYRATLEGEVTCLPHVGDGPHTMECAYGLKTDVGEYYALDLAALTMPEGTMPETGDRISANGTVTPIEMVSSDHWRTYDIEGIFSVTDSLEVL